MLGTFVKEVAVEMPKGQEKYGWQSSPKSPLPPILYFKEAQLFSDETYLFLFQLL